MKANSPNVNTSRSIIIIGRLVEGNHYHRDDAVINLLAVQDPLNDKTVIINIQIKPDSKKRDQRTALVTVGISGQVPIMLNGPFGQLHELIDQAWRSFRQNATDANAAIAEAPPPKQVEQPKAKKESILSLF